MSYVKLERTNITNFLVHLTLNRYLFVWVGSLKYNPCNNFYIIILVKSVMDKSSGPGNDLFQQGTGTYSVGAHS